MLVPGYLRVVSSSAGVGFCELSEVAKQVKGASLGVANGSALLLGCLVSAVGPVLVAGTASVSQQQLSNPLSPISQRPFGAGCQLDSPESAASSRFLRDPKSLSTSAGNSAN